MGVLQKKCIFPCTLLFLSNIFYLFFQLHLTIIIIMIIMAIENVNVHKKYIQQEKKSPLKLGEKSLQCNIDKLKGKIFNTFVQDYYNYMLMSMLSIIHNIGKTLYNSQFCHKIISKKFSSSILQLHCYIFITALTNVEQSWKKSINKKFLPNNFLSVKI